MGPGPPAARDRQARFERTVLGFAVGAALGLAGALMQGLTRNPLADPGILGVNAGATFAMVVGMTAFGFTAMGQFLPMAFVGAAAAALGVHAIASLGRDGATPMKLAITGAALSAGLASWTTGLLLADRKTMESFRFWQVGTIGGRGFDVLARRTAVPASSARCSRSPARGCSTPSPSARTWRADSVVVRRATGS